jgi:hypothetical protein
MTEWILVIMMCSRNCQPQYAEIYPTKETCIAKVTPSSNWELPKQYCIPLIKVKE